CDRRCAFEAHTVVGLFLQSGYALLPSQPHHRVSSRLTPNLTLFVALQPSLTGRRDFEQNVLVFSKAPLDGFANQRANNTSFMTETQNA
ncbi:MAG: hypothetical protein II336_20665, partial [Loktanella sp.]|nr:hypothetical protein [Loktanella sp.]